MEDNRFLRVYNDHKREKEAEKQQLAFNRFENNRFECLRSEPLRPVLEKNTNNRFDCLRGETNRISVQSTDKTSNRFNCLIDNNYERYPSSNTKETTTYISRPQPKESINTQMKHYQEEKRIKAKPALTVESAYHFPELSKPVDILHPNVKTSEEMIVNSIIIPVKMESRTILLHQNGKIVTKDVYLTGTNVSEEPEVIVKKPHYNTWASVLKKEQAGEVQYDIEKVKLSDLEGKKLKTTLH